MDRISHNEIQNHQSHNPSKNKTLFWLRDLRPKIPCSLYLQSPVQFDHLRQVILVPAPVVLSARGSTLRQGFPRLPEERDKGKMLNCSEALVSACRGPCLRRLHDNSLWMLVAYSQHARRLHTNMNSEITRSRCHMR